jgi:hypothetical protein
VVAIRTIIATVCFTDTHQSEAIAAILNKYGWIYFSILTSYDSYGETL